MLKIDLATPPGGLTVLAVGAHPDDIEIGCGGTVLRLASEGRLARVHWLVLSGAGTEREAEARAGAAAFLAHVAAVDVLVEAYRDGAFPYLGTALKDRFEALKAEVAPDLILTHHPADAHQDHRMVAELTWQTFRDHLILGFEIPKFDGDPGQPEAFVEITPEHARRKCQLLRAAYASQSSRHWFTDETFLAMLRLRGIESRAGSGYAEAFHARKLVL